MKQPDEISREFIQRILSRLEQLDEDKQDIFFNSFLDNLEMEEMTKLSMTTDGSTKMLYRSVRHSSPRAIERNFADMFASLKTLVEAVLRCLR